MEQKTKRVRKPQQKRSLEKLELIKSAAMQLFSEKGYFDANTNEIAKQAGISIGRLYSYECTSCHKKFTESIPQKYQGQG